MEIIDQTIAALKQINVPRYFTTERAFVTEFHHHLRNKIEDIELFPPETILETEVQKRNKDHFGVTQRPDLLIHIPIETGLTDNPDENNFVVYAFKRNGSLKPVRNDFKKLDIMFEKLNYNLGIFINIGAYPRSYLHIYQGSYKERIHEITNILVDGNVYVKHACFQNNEVRIVEV